jgi:hypothetical protein
MPSGLTRRRALSLFGVLLLSFCVRGLTAQFIRSHLTDPAWFQSGAYAIFEDRARGILAGRVSAFRIDDPARTDSIIYPPGYPLWLALIYKVRPPGSAAAAQGVQWVLDSLSVLLVVGVGATCYGWRVGLCAGAAAALSPLLALYGATPSADAPTNWIVLGGVWGLLLAARRDSLRWALCAGAMLGASCWLRANALLLPGCWAAALPLLGGRRLGRLRLSLAVVAGALLLVSPLLIRNAVAFHALVPTGLGAGTNLWEGIGETERGAEFGAVIGDAALAERERAEMNLPPDAPLSLYQPDGINRDRARARKALKVIAAHPVWYAGVMARRMWAVLKYTGPPRLYTGSAGVVVASRRSLPEEWRGGGAALAVNALGALQRVFSHLALPLMIVGVWLALRRDRAAACLLLTTVLYYLVVGSSMHTEIRYGLPMQSLLLVFAGLAACRLRQIVYGAALKRGRAEDRQHEPPAGAREQGGG